MKTDVKKAQAQLFLAFLLAPLVGGRPRFRLVAGPFGLTVGLAIGGSSRRQRGVDGRRCRTRLVRDLCERC